MKKSGESKEFFHIPRGPFWSFPQKPTTYLNIHQAQKWSLDVLADDLRNAVSDCYIRHTASLFCKQMRLLEQTSLWICQNTYQMTKAEEKHFVEDKSIVPMLCPPQVSFQALKWAWILAWICHINCHFQILPDSLGFS